MTTMGEESKTCGVCGFPQTVHVLCSTNQMTPSDLDLRPGEMARSTMPLWVQECASCGYCAADLSKAPASAVNLVRSDSYQQFRNEPRWPPLARRFLGSALILAAGANYVEAFHAALRAAWACDDALAPVPARECRLKALAYASQARQDGKALAEAAGMEDLILADIHRRARHFIEAASVARRGLLAGPEKLVSEGLTLEIRLSDERDDACHSTGELESLRAQVEEARARAEWLRDRKSARRKRRLERVVSTDHACPHCGFRMSEVRLLLNDSGDRARAVCASCGCTSPWEGAIPERPPRTDLP